MVKADNPWPAILREAKLASGQTIPEIAKAIGVLPNTFSQWLYGIRTPSGPACQLLREYLKKRKNSACQATA